MVLDCIQCRIVLFSGIWGKLCQLSQTDVTTFSLRKDATEMSHILPLKVCARDNKVQIRVHLDMNSN